MHPLLSLVKNHKQDRTVGIYSVCSANEFVLKAAMQQAQQDENDLLIESTSNQVDQYGGYTGMTPGKFVSYVYQLADSCNFSRDRLILGGDHLGPHNWQNEMAATAMSKAHELIRSCVKAGYSKIHLDTSMRLADDRGESHAPLAVETVARRAAELCLTAEKAAAEIANHDRPIYVIGTDVPKPGGAQEELSEVHVTPIEEIEETITVTQKAYFDLGLKDTWKRVVAVVAQPGVEFGDTSVIEYQSQRAQEISRYIEQYPHLIYEAHSTDYQKKESLKQLVEDHFAILKVGPWLTFTFREVLFGLTFIEKDWLSGSKTVLLSNLLELVEQVMAKNPKFWIAHYRGKEDELKFARKYSLSDRIRYYWPDPQIQKSMKTLLSNLSRKPIPLTLLSQYLPNQCRAIKYGEIRNHPLAIISHKIREVIKIYSYATGCAHQNSEVLWNNYSRN